MLQWMHHAAKEQNLTEEGYHGGLYYDETKIQEDLEIDRKDGKITLTGFADTGEEGENLRILRDKQV